MSTPATPAQLRSIYRSILRELPPRTGATISPLQSRIRATLASDAGHAIEHTDQFLRYVKAQRMYTMLVDRYNPGINFNEEERVRLTARRVGMNLPIEFKPDGGDGDKGSQA